MARPRSARPLAVLVALGLAVGLAGGTFAAFSDQTSNTGNTFSAAADLTPPTATASVIQRSTGGTPGYLIQGADYYVYANANDAGSPASGIASLTADVSNVTAGQTAAALSAAGGPFTVGGVTYSYRSSLLTADDPLSSGSKSYSVTLTDNAGNVGTTTGFSVTIDNVAPAGADIQTTNVGGGTLGKAEAGDTITFTYTKPMSPTSILAGWDGSATTVTLQLQQNASLDLVAIFDSANTTQLPLGVVSLNANHVNGNTRNFTGSTMVMSGSSITVTLGTPDASTLTTGNATMTWVPSASATDLAGNPCSTATVTESGAADPSF
jgi:predicted ribosomally synthesized peptide with SipW-like signal peptide